MYVLCCRDQCCDIVIMYEIQCCKPSGLLDSMNMLLPIITLPNTHHNEYETDQIKSNPTKCSKCF